MLENINDSRVSLITLFTRVVTNETRIGGLIAPREIVNSSSWRYNVLAWRRFQNPLSREERRRVSRMIPSVRRRQLSLKFSGRGSPAVLARRAIPVSLEEFQSRVRVYPSALSRDLHGLEMVSLRARFISIPRGDRCSELIRSSCLRVFFHGLFTVISSVVLFLSSFCSVKIRKT